MKKIIVMVMSVFMLTVALCGCGGAGSPEDAVENFVDAALEADVEAMIECMPPQISEIAMDGLTAYGFDFDAQAAELKRKISDDAEYEIKSKEKMDKEEIAKFEKRLVDDAEELAEFSDVEADSEIEIEEAYYVKYEITIDGDTDKESLPVGKIDGSWYILTTDFDDVF